jgi:glutathione peroxidase
MDQQHSEESTVEILNKNIYNIPFNSLDGESEILSNYNGKVTMIVNVTGECANSAQYNIIQDLYDEYKEKGFEVIATPSTDFCQDAYGEFKNSNASAENMRSHMKKKYGTNLFFSEMVDIKETEEKNPHPLYKELQRGGGPVQGNFEKFIVSKDGKRMKRFCNSDLLDLGFNSGNRTIDSQTALSNIKKAIEDFLQEDDKNNSN